MTTSEENNKAVVDEFIQALFTNGDLSAVDRYLADDFVAHDPPMLFLIAAFMRIEPQPGNRSGRTTHGRRRR